MNEEARLRREAEEDRLREERNFEYWAAQATDQDVQKHIAKRTENAYDRMLGAWDK